MMLSGEGKENNMECPKCEFMQPDGGTECLKCGIIFDKYISKQHRHMSGISDTAFSEAGIEEETDLVSRSSFLRELFLYVKPEEGFFSFAGRSFLYLLIVVWGLKFIFTPLESNYTGESFMHLINLPFHEAGHIFFRIFGRFMAVLGGSLMQVLVPLVCLLTLLFKTRDTFGASVSLWWVGESLMDLSPYINDARDLKLTLLGGVTGRDVDDYHDWEFILRELGLLRNDHMLAKTAYFIGTVLMLVTFVWGGFLLYKQFINIKSGKPSLE
jgi:hypothetical protein